MSGRSAFRCRPITPRVWNGRYKRVPGMTTTFHIRLVDRDWWPIVEWEIGDVRAVCPMVCRGDVHVLVAAVNEAKAAAGAAPGGAFLIDEHGRVLVPLSSPGRGYVIVAAECSGPLLFHDPFNSGDVFELYDDTGLTCGDPWYRPYVGIPHNLSRYDELYFWQESVVGACKLLPPGQDAPLIRALRKVRPYGPVRFLVGPGGVAVTKTTSPGWEPCYVGRVDLAMWFPKEIVL